MKYANSSLRINGLTFLCALTLTACLSLSSTHDTQSSEDAIRFPPSIQDFEEGVQKAILLDTANAAHQKCKADAIGSTLAELQCDSQLSHDKVEIEGWLPEVQPDFEGARRWYAVRKAVDIILAGAALQAGADSRGMGYTKHDPRNCDDQYDDILERIEAMDGTIVPDFFGALQFIVEGQNTFPVALITSDIGDFAPEIQKAILLQRADNALSRCEAYQGQESTTACQSFYNQSVQEIESEFPDIEPDYPGANQAQNNYN